MPAGEKAIIGALRLIACPPLTVSAAPSFILRVVAAEKFATPDGANVPLPAKPKLLVALAALMVAPPIVPLFVRVAPLTFIESEPLLLTVTLALTFVAADATVVNDGLKFKVLPPPALASAKVSDCPAVGVIWTDVPLTVVLPPLPGPVMVIGASTTPSLIVTAAVPAPPTVVPVTVKFTLGELIVSVAELLTVSLAPTLIAEEPESIARNVTLPPLAPWEKA